MEVYRFAGRPLQKAGRAPEELACYDFLDGLEVFYDRADHPAAHTMELCRDVEAVLEAPICKNLFLCNRQETSFYLLLLEGDKPFKTKYLSAQLGCSRLSFAAPEYMEQYLGASPGSASILGLLHDTQKRVQLVIDRPLLRRPWFACHPCRNTSTVRFSTEALTGKVIPALNHTPVYVELPREAE